MGGVPVGRWWQNLQDRYAKAYGSRILTVYKTRKDKGQRRPHLDIKRGGKQTLTSIKRERAIVVSMRPPLWQGGESPTNVFGHKPLRAAQLKELYQKEESDQFKELIIKAQKKAQQRKQEVDYLHAAQAESGTQASRKKQARRCFRLCDLPARKRQAIIQKNARRKARCMNSCFVGGEFTWEQVRAHMGRAWPVVLVEDVDHLPGRGLLEVFGGHPLGEYVVDMVAFMAEVHPLRRVILVHDIMNVPWRLQLVAVTLGAGLQEQMLRPMLRYKMMKECVITFSLEFRRAHRGVVDAARLLHERSVRMGGRSATEGKASFKMMRCKAFIADVTSLLKKKGGQAKSRRTHAILCCGLADASLQEFPENLAGLARPFPEFSQAFSQLDRRAVWGG